MFRDATPEDRAPFIALWADYLLELEKLGGEYDPTDRRTLGAVADLFVAYTTGQLRGVCVLYQPPGQPILGAAFCGEDGGTPTIPPVKWGKVAWGWGVYLVPEARTSKVSGPLQIEAGRRLKSLGFDTLVGDILLENKASLAATQAAGWKPHSVVHVCDLATWEHG